MRSVVLTRHHRGRTAIRFPQHPEGEFLVEATGAEQSLAVPQGEIVRLPVGLADDAPRMALQRDLTDLPVIIRISLWQILKSS